MTDRSLEAAAGMREIEWIETEIHRPGIIVMFPEYEDRTPDGRLIRRPDGNGGWSYHLPEHSMAVTFTSLAAAIAAAYPEAD